MPTHLVRILFGLLLCCGLAGPARALDTVQLEPGPVFPLGAHLEILEDPGGGQTLSDILAPPLKDMFQPSTQETPNLGFTRSAWWLRFRLANPDPQPKQWLLELDSANIDWVDFYVPEGPGVFQRKSSGRRVAFSQRDIKHRNIVFRLTTPPQAQQTYYLRVQSTASLYLPITLMSAEAFAARDHEFQLGFGFYYGIILVMIFYNLVLFLALRDKNHLYYVLTLITLHGLFQLSLNGLATEYLWPQSLWLTNHAVGLFMNLGFFFGILFSQSFLKTSENLPRLHRLFTGFRTAALVLALMNLAPDDSFPEFLSVFWSTKLGLVAAIGIWTMGFLSWRKGYQPARFFLIAWSSTIFGGIVLSLRALGLLPSSFLTNYALQIGAAFEVILLSLALGDRMHVIQREKYAAQAEALEQERLTRQAQAELVRHLQKMDKLKDEFLANISHELRTPLNGIIGLSESLLDGVAGPLNDPQQDNLRLVVSSGKRLFSLVSDLLDFSQLKHQDITLNLRPLGMREIAEVVLALSQPLIGHRNLALVNAIPAEAPPVEADENRLQQILHNLVGNAIKFTPTGTVEVSAARTGNFLEVSVSDTGIGIPADKLPRIFESFEQVDGSATREYGGTGLGLAITRKLVELHGGQMRVESRIGQGSTFHFLLPLAREVVGEEVFRPLAVKSITGEIPAPSAGRVTSLLDLRQATVRLDSDEQTSDRYNILIVDDETVNLQVLVNVLSLQKFTVTKALSGPEALELIRQQRFDLILLDIMMPRMSGYEVCKAVRQQYLPNELPIVFLTAKTQVSSLIEGFDAGANDYLTKPIRKHELMARIKTHLHLSQINASYARFVPREFLQFLGHDSIMDVRLGDQVQEDMTIMFADIRAFTSLSETLTPKQNFDFINDYLRRISPIIRDHQGFIDKYIGDGLMALFPGKVENALDAALAMLTALESYNRERLARGYQPVRIGIGLHTGSLMLGTIGEAERMEGTVISDAVNLAARMEDLTKRFGASLIVSEETYQQVRHKQKYRQRFLGRAQVKGKKETVGVLEIFNGDSPAQIELKTISAEDFEMGLQAFYEHNRAYALLCFQKVLACNPDDSAAQYYARRCQDRRGDGSGDGVVVF